MPYSASLPVAECTVLQRAHYPRTYDPIVLAHARALLTGKPGTTAYADADARDTGRILAEAAATLDFTQPVGIMLIAVLHCIPDEDDPRGPRSRVIQTKRGGIGDGCDRTAGRDTGH